MDEIAQDGSVWSLHCNSNVSEHKQSTKKRRNAARMSFKGNCCWAVIITVPSQPCSLCFCLDWWLCCSPSRSLLGWFAALYSVCKRRRKIIQSVFMTNIGLLFDVKSRDVFIHCASVEIFFFKKKCPIQVLHFDSKYFVMNHMFIKYINYFYFISSKNN